MLYNNITKFKEEKIITLLFNLVFSGIISYISKNLKR